MEPLNIGEDVSEFDVVSRSQKGKCDLKHQNDICKFKT
jgi:hypothetical protein